MLEEGGFYRGSSWCKGLEVRDIGQSSWRTGSSFIWLKRAVLTVGERKEGGCSEKDGWRVNGDQIMKIFVNHVWLFLEGLQ